MPDHLHFILRTERGATEPVEIRCSCDDFWSVAQQRAMEELYARKFPVQPGVLDLRRTSVRIIPRDPLPDPRLPPPRHFGLDGRVRELSPHIRHEYMGLAVRYATRAKRIARAYACMFLEDFEHGNPTLLGRFYWAGLAAFASKQVAFTAERFLVSAYAPNVLRMLGKGNLWLYNDAWPWHYAWALCPGSVQMCLEKREAPNLDPVVLENLREQDWAHEVLPQLPWNIDEKTGTVGAAIGQLKVAPIMREVIQEWKRSATEAQPNKAGQGSLKELLAMARHEQGEILQGLIYGDAHFVQELEQTRSSLERWPNLRTLTMFKLQLSFSAQEYVESPEWRSDAPFGIRLQDYKERMDWIKDTAQQYDRLMSGSCRQGMLDELRTLARFDG